MPDDRAPTPDFGRIYDENFAKVYNYVRYRVGDAAAADDVVARVFEKALARLSGFDPRRGPAAAWLFAIARSAVIDHFRAKAWFSWLPLDAFHGRPDPAPGSEELLSKDEERRALLESMAVLDEREREILALRFGGGMTNREIAAALELSDANVGVIIHRALKKMKGSLGEDQ